MLWLTFWGTFFNLCLKPGWIRHFPHIFLKKTYFRYLAPKLKQTCGGHKQMLHQSLSQVTALSSKLWWGYRLSLPVNWPQLSIPISSFLAFKYVVIGSICSSKINVNLWCKSAPLSLQQNVLLQGSTSSGAQLRALACIKPHGKWKDIA